MMPDPPLTEPQGDHVEPNPAIRTPSPEHIHPLAMEDTTPLRFSAPEKWDIEWQKHRTWSILGLTWADSGECARAGLEESPDRSAYEPPSNQGWSVGITQRTTAANCFSSRERIEVTVNSQRLYKRGHLVLGIMNKRTGLPRETAIDNIDSCTDSLNSGFKRFRLPRLSFFAAIRKGTRHLRPWWRRVFSLKSVSGFSVYECLPKQSYHVAVEIDDRTKAVLADFYREYVHSRSVPEELAALQGWRWSNWIQETFNRGDAEDGAPCLTLELVLKWSVSKICIYGLTPVVFSLVIGFWFQYSQTGDQLAVVQTAWTISSYIIGASSGE